jgi:glycosyltransferase involved in cell wall biosynthesis
MPRPLISVILACYNHEKFVSEAVDGVLGQSYSPLEILIVDDCSPDNTAQIIERRLSQRATRHEVRLIRNSQNLGGPEANRQALRMARGELLISAQGDDIMLPTMVEEMAAAWRDENVSLVTANGEYIDEESRSLNRTFRDPNAPADDSFETLARDGSNACSFGPAIAFEREIFTKFGWNTDFLGAYDIIYPFYAYLLKGAKFLNKVLVKYRVHGSNTSLSLAAEKADDHERLRVQERVYFGHLAHAVLMEEELTRLAAEEPERYVSVAERILPLLQIQLAEMAKKLVRTRREMSDHLAASKSRPSG